MSLADAQSARRDVRYRALAIAPIAIRAVLGVRLRKAFGILLYHRVAEVPDSSSVPTHNVTPQRFRTQLEGLLHRGYDAWPLRRVLTHHLAKQPIPRNVFVVTFDDGFENVYGNAWPVLQDLQVPATVFLATAFLDSNEPFPFEDWADAGSDRVGAETWRPLTTEQCEEMIRGGLVEFGAHTHTHADFRGRPEAFHDDLVTSVDVLRRKFGIEDAPFAFPYGRKQPGFAGGALTEAARRAGVRCALTTENDMVVPTSDPYDWGRFHVAESDSAATLGAKLDGWYSVTRNLARRLTGESV